MVALGEPAVGEDLIGSGGSFVIVCDSKTM